MTFKPFQLLDIWIQTSSNIAMFWSSIFHSFCKWETFNIFDTIKRPGSFCVDFSSLKRFIWAFQISNPKKLLKIGQDLGPGQEKESSEPFFFFCYIFYLRAKLIHCHAAHTHNQIKMCLLKCVSSSSVYFFPFVLSHLTLVKI